jgi:hypothetical protein
MNEIIEQEKNNKELSKKSWIDNLKDQSWEAELLVSAIAIFGTFQLFSGIDWWVNAFINVLNPSQYFIGYMIVFFGLLAVSILVAMFVIHFFLRSYWIGLIGLNSVFSDYSIENSVYSKIYTKKIISILPKLKHSIHKVDELCSVIFSAAFTFLLMYGYIALFSCAYILLYNTLSEYIAPIILLVPLALIVLTSLAQFAVTMFSNLKSNHNNEKLQTWNFRLVRISSMITFGPLYKSILQVSMIFGSNFKKKKSLVYLILVFLISGAGISLFKVFDSNIPYLIGATTYYDETKVYSEYYATENTNNTFLLAPEIESDKITSSLVKVFIPIYTNEKRRREGVCERFISDENNSKSVERQNKRIHFLDCYKKYHQVYIDEELVSADFLKYTHPRTKQFGILAYIEFFDLKRGMHRLKVVKNFGEGDIQQWSIPFYNVIKEEIN